MPIEIKELHIRVAVNTPQSEQSPDIQSTASGNRGSDIGDTDKEAFLAECVDQVLQNLQRKKER